MKTLLLVDGHNFLFRSFAVPFKFYSQKGTPLHVLTTFLKLIRRSIDIIDKEDDLYLAVVFDTQTVTTNHELSKEYKANRTKDFSQMADNPFIHLPVIQEVLKSINIPIFEISGIEADDVIATLNNKFKNDNDDRVYIASHDSDFYQLLDRRTKIIKHLQKGQSIIIDEDYVFNKVGVKVSDYVYFKSLMGDKADNISGIPNIGSIRAKKIVNKEMSFDLSTYKEILKRNISLITLNENINLDANIKDLKYLGRLSVSNKAIFSKCGL